MNIEGCGVIVTGGGSGLGEATARLFAERGAKVAILDFDAERGQMVADDIGGFFAKTDVSDAASVEVAVKALVTAFGEAPRVAVNCAGIGLAKRIVGREGVLSLDLFDKVIRVNLYGSYNVMSYAAQAMMALDPMENGERGVIINTSSAAYQDGQVGQTAYAASKGAISAISLPAAREFAQSAIRVMAIAPGLFSTPMMESLPKDVTDAIVKNIPFPARLGAPDEYALMAAQIVENPYLNGTTIRLDGATRLPQR